MSFQVLSALLSLGSSVWSGGQAIDTQKDAINFAKKIYRRTWKGTRPYRELGELGIGRLSDFWQGSPEEQQAWLEQQPGYHFRLSQSERALDRAQSASRASGGRAIDEALLRARDFATSELNTYFDPLYRLSDIGMSGLTLAANTGIGAASTVGNVANSLAQTYQNVGANINQSLQGGMSNMQTMSQYQDWMRMFGGSGGSNISFGGGGFAGGGGG